MGDEFQGHRLGASGLSQKPPVLPVEAPRKSVTEVPGEEMRHELP